MKGFIKKVTKRVILAIIFIFSLVGAVGTYLLATCYARSRTNTPPDWLTLAKEHLSSVSAFSVGLIVWSFGYLVVWCAVRFLHIKGGTSYQSKSVKEIALSKYIAVAEQLLFYFVAISGPAFFGAVAAGWLLFKGVSRYVLWNPSDPTKTISVYPSPPDPELEAALAHNRFQIFLVGTGMSIATGGVAGAAYHYANYLLTYPEQLIGR